MDDEYEEQVRLALEDLEDLEEGEEEWTRAMMEKTDKYRFGYLENKGFKRLYYYFQCKARGISI